MMMDQHTVSPQNALSVRYIVRTNRSTTFASVIVTLTLNTVKQSLNKTLRFMTVYSQTKFGSKKVRNSEVLIETVVLNLYYVSAVNFTLKMVTQLFR